MRSSSALRVLVQLARRRAVLRVIEDRRKAPLQLPRREEERPVDERRQLLERHVAKLAAADERRRRRAASRAQSIFSRFASAVVVRQQRPLFARAVLVAQLLLQLAVRLLERVALRSSLSRLETTSTTRDASSTWTVVPLYSGAIFTAVCCRLVVAPPMSSGMRCARRSISFATNTISSSDGVIRPLRPMRSAFSSSAVCRIFVGRHHHAEIDDLVAVAAEHDADDVLADVVHVALDGRQHDLALRAVRPRRLRPSAPCASASMNGSR